MDQEYLKISRTGNGRKWTSDRRIAGSFLSGPFIEEEAMNSMEYRSWISGYLEISREVLYLTQEECRKIPITHEEILESTEKALVAYSTKKAEMPAKIGIHPLKNTFFHAMPAYIPEAFASGIKWGSCYPDNRERFGYSQANGLILFNDHESGCPLCIMDCIYVTEMRTPAVSYVAAKYLADANAESFGMIGCGVQGRQHVANISKVLPRLKKIYVFDTYEPAADKLIRDLQPGIGAKIVKAESFEEIAKSSEVLASATVITEKPEPEIKDAWIGKGQTLLLCDCHSLYEDATMKRADKYLLDSVEQHNLLIGYGYYPEGLPAVYGETGEVAAGLRKGRENPEELIVCNNVGMAVEDMMMVRVLFDRALELGIGRKLPL
jgi:ornithine cyclodeaminase/alanine dehydrogenase